MPPYEIENLLSFLTSVKLSKAGKQAMTYRTAFRRGNTESPVNTSLVVTLRLFK